MMILDSRLRFWATLIRKRKFYEPDTPCWLGCVSLALVVVAGDGLVGIRFTENNSSGNLQGGALKRGNVS